ncbi:hypothetical protein EMIHUDRAFT_455409 [Emiliania huxleyi CCMP1516]|uniref:Protein O-linked-mannose beta-1,4-N-acetylglucosaminyltransferase 2 n=2 Tax=Emiliania huxleyi TaxID=2903 RepID=A0A0D3KH76_EMIH1|nr:hypothetical protein EMIHUDRAFT_455409 [Emiliania huxleyi CCMP1516]EOD35111.1 hypothetical protein EMIHUDRAFT_455409 [Emiliania huxleyi CCMP1516]|eukprot:XP_005787540.1 hypothetical protein EMIHUDRAFT_455409 [Emiliania huxleyi CCMP1516]
MNGVCSRKRFWGWGPKIVVGNGVLSVPKRCRVVDGNTLLRFCLRFCWALLLVTRESATLGCAGRFADNIVPEIIWWQYEALPLTRELLAYAFPTARLYFGTTDAPRCLKRRSFRPQGTRGTFTAATGKAFRALVWRRLSNATIAALRSHLPAALRSAGAAEAPLEVVRLPERPDSLCDQVRRYAEADVLISPHGAHLVHIPQLSPSAVFIEAAAVAETSFASRMRKPQPPDERSGKTEEQCGREGGTVRGCLYAAMNCFELAVVRDKHVSLRNRAGPLPVPRADAAAGGGIGAGGKRLGRCTAACGGADPTMVVFGGRYLLFLSKNGGYYASNDLVRWSLIVPTGAPDRRLRRHMEGRLFFTASHSRALYTTDDPFKGKWREVATLPSYADPALFLDDDGRVYLAYGSHQTWGPTGGGNASHVVELDPARGWREVSHHSAVAFADAARNGWEVSGNGNDDYRLAPYVEGPWITKVGGVYFLQYASPGTQFFTYSDGFFVAKSLRDLGHSHHSKYSAVSPFSAKPTGFMRGAGHGSIFRGLDGGLWHVTIAVIARHIRRLVINPVHVQGEWMNADTRPDWQLLSLHKPATASSTSGANAPSRAFDEDIRTCWSAETGAAGEWLAVDLGANATAYAVQLNFAEVGAKQTGRLPLRDACRYYCEASADGVRWTVVPELDRREGGRDSPHDYVALRQPLSLRHLRVISAHTPAGAAFGLSDLRIFGTTAAVKPPARVGAPRVTRDSADARRASVAWDAAARAEWYVVRFGERGAPGQFHSYQVYGGATSLETRALSAGVEYDFVVDAFNEGGRTVGTPTAPRLAQRHP